MWSNLFKRKPKYDASLIPSNIAPLIGSIVHDPNCWNATIMYFDPKEPVRFTGQSDMEHWLNKNTVESLYQRCVPRTILALYNEDLGLIHTAVYIGDGVLFHKRGCGGHWEIITEKMLRAIYNETTHCKLFVHKSGL